MCTTWSDAVEAIDMLSTAWRRWSRPAAVGILLDVLAVARERTSVGHKSANGQIQRENRAETPDRNVLRTADLLSTMLITNQNREVKFQSAMGATVHRLLNRFHMVGRSGGGKEG